MYCFSDRNNEAVVSPTGKSFTTLATISKRDSFSSDYLILPSKNPASHQQYIPSRDYLTSYRTTGLTEMSTNSPTNTDSPISGNTTAKKAATRKNGTKITKARAMQEARKVALLEKREDMRRKATASGAKKRAAAASSNSFDSPPQPFDVEAVAVAEEEGCHRNRTRLLPMASFELYDRSSAHSSPHSHHSYSSLSGTEDDRSYVSNLTGKESSESSQDVLLLLPTFVAKQGRYCAPTKKRLCCAPTTTTTTTTNQPHAPCGHLSSFFSQQRNYPWQAQVQSECGSLCATVQQQQPINPHLFLEPVNLLHNHLVHEGIVDDRGSKDDDDVYRWMSSFLEAESCTRL